MGSYTYELLQLDRWGELEEIAKLGPLPSPLNSNAIVTRNSDGKIIGALFLQGELRAEPFVVLPEYRNTGVSLSSMLKCLDDNLTPLAPVNYHVYVQDKPELVRKHHDMGFVEVEGVVPFVKFIEPPEEVE